MEKKWNLQDIKPAERRPQPSRSPRREIEETQPSPTQEPKRERRIRSEKNPKSGKKGLVLGGIVFGLIIVVSFVLAILNSGAEVTVFPKTREPLVNAVFEASANATANDLAYEIMTLEATGEREVVASGQEDVETKAEGSITIYKTTAGSEQLRVNTRFQTPDGLIFRIKEGVSVPGGTSEKPGIVRAYIIAEEAGTKYNISANTKFTVPGFKESDLMDLFNAISAENSSEITGGYSGPRFMIDDAELSAATQSLQTELESALKERLKNERPAGFTIFDSAAVFVYRDLPAEDSGGDKVKLKQKTILQIPIFKNEDFASHIASVVVPGYEKESVRIEDMSVFSFEYATTTTDITTRDSISFRLVGKPKIIWVFDENQLKQDLSGGTQTSLNTVLGGYPAIEKATATIRPFWNRSFPEKTEDISIVEVTGS